MASIDDVFNAVNKVNTTVWKLIAAVEVVGTSVNNEITATNTVATDVNTLDGDVKAGFAATTTALQALVALEEAAVKLLYHLTQQADTMICSLGQISKNTCGILTQVTIQTELQKRLVADANTIRAIDEATNPAATLQLLQLAELKAQIEKCCPPKPPEPACTYQACPAPAPIDADSLKELIAGAQAKSGAPAANSRG
jgi:invasion protein IalB